MRVTHSQRLAGLRIALSATGVALGLSMQLSWLREIHLNAIVGLLNVAGVEAVKLNQFTFSIHQTPIEITSACTCFEIALAVIPLIYKSSWNRQKALLSLIPAIALFEAINILRLTIGFVLYAHGLSWDSTHAIPSGVFYFLILYLVLTYGGWVRRDSQRYMVLSIPDQN